MKNTTIVDFIEKTSSNSPTPGGGSVAAVLASLSASLASMSASLTINKKGYEEVSDKMNELYKLFNEKAHKYLDFINKDIDSFNDLMATYKLKKDTDEEKEYRTKEIQDKTMNALLVPYSLALDIYGLLNDIKYCYYEGNKNVKSDALMAMIIARSAILSCLCNVYINLNSLKDCFMKDEINYACDKIKREVIDLEKELINNSSYFRI